MSKPSNLKIFQDKQEVQIEQSRPSKRQVKGERGFVSCTIRLRRVDWQRLQTLALAEGSSLQQLGLEGFSQVLKTRGLPDEILPP